MISTRVKYPPFARMQSMYTALLYPAWASWTGGLSNEISSQSVVEVSTTDQS